MEDGAKKHVKSEVDESFDDTASGISIRHLHLDPIAIDQIATLGCITISDIAGALTNSNLSMRSRDKLTTSCFRLLECASGSDVDWLAYYEHPNFEPSCLYFNCMEFQNINSDNPVFLVNQSSFGDAGAMLEHAGYKTFGLLVDQLRKGIPEMPPGFDIKNLRTFWNELTGLAKATRADPKVLQVWAIQHPIARIARSESTDVTNRQISGYEKTESKLSPQICALDLGVLHLGKKTDTLREQELMTIGDVAEYPRWKLLSLPYMGKTTISRIAEGMEALALAQRPDGEVDWEIYCDLMQLALLPAQPLEGSLTEIIALLPHIIEEAILSGESEDNRIILKNRIMRLPSERLTLEAVGELMPIRITRERVRQKEGKILRRLADSLILEDYAKASYHFRPEFTAPWRKAAEHFASIETDISLNELISGLETAWRIPSKVFQEQLPLITAIITGELPTGEDFRKAMPIEANLLSQGTGAALAAPLKLLQTKKAAGALAEKGLFKVGDFLDAAASGEVDTEKGPASVARKHIGFLAQCVNVDGHIDWPNYARLAEVPIFPEYEILSPEDFLPQIIPTAIGVLETRALSVIAPRTFQLRTSLPLQDRPTTDALAMELSVHGPSVKMVETKLLKFLHEVFLEHHLSIARTHVRQDFLAYWSEVDQAFNEVDGDAELVKRVLTGRWGVSSEALEPYMPSIVAIMTGYPMGRLGRNTKMQNKIIPILTTNRKERIPEKNPKADTLPQRVVLRGFRRTH